MSNKQSNICDSSSRKGDFEKQLDDSKKLESSPKSDERKKTDAFYENQLKTFEKYLPGTSAEFKEGILKRINKSLDDNSKKKKE